MKCRQTMSGMIGIAAPLLACVGRASGLGITVSVPVTPPGGGAAAAQNIGTITATAQMPAGIKADFVLDPKYAWLDDWYDFQWVQLVTSYTVNGVAQDSNMDGNSDAPVIGELPGVDPPTTDGPDPYYYNAGEWNSGLFGSEIIRTERVRSKLVDYRSGHPVNTVITFHTYLVVDDITAGGFPDQQFCVIAGFEWTYSQNDPANGMPSAVMVGAALPVNAAAITEITTGLANANPAFPPPAGAMPAGAAWTPIMGCTLTGCGTFGRKATWPRYAKAYTITSYKYTNTKPGEPATTPPDPAQPETTVCWEALTAPVNVPAGPGDPVCTRFKVPFNPNDLHMEYHWDNTPLATTHNIKVPNKGDTFTWKWYCLKVETFPATVCQSTTGIVGCFDPEYVCGDPCALVFDPAASEFFGDPDGRDFAIPTAAVLLREGQALPGAAEGQNVNSINNPATNHVGGYAVQVNTTDGVTTLSHVWGDALGGAGTVLRTEGTFGPYTQTSYETFFGFSDDGSSAYSPPVNGGPIAGADSVWLDDDPVAISGLAHPTLPGQFWRFGSRPGVTAGGVPYFVGGIASTPSGATQNRGLFFGLNGGTVLLLGGQSLPNLPNPLSMTATNPGFDYRMSANATHYIAPVQMTGLAATDTAVVVDGAGLLIGGTLVQEGTTLPASAGGMVGENWANFDFMGISETGQYFFTGDSSLATTADEFIVKNGAILYRDGMLLDGETLQGDIEAAYMNENGDIAFIWDVQANTIEALYLNEKLLLREGDSVDLDGDGLAEPNSVVANFTGIASLAISDRDPDGMVDVYFTADIDVNGTASTTDDIEGVFRITAAVTAPVNIAAANPPALNPYGSGVFRDVLENTTTALAAQGIGVTGTPAEGPYNYAPISVTFSGTPSPPPAPTTPPTPGSVQMACTGGLCPTVMGVSGSGAGPYLLTLSGGIPVLHCTTFTFAGTNAGQKLQYQNLPGDLNLNGTTTGQDVLTQVVAINNGTAALPANLARYDTNRNGAATGQDVLRLVQLINGTSATQAFNGAAVAACP